MFFLCIVFKWPHLQGFVCDVFIRRTWTLSCVVLCMFVAIAGLFSYVFFIFFFASVRLFCWQNIKKKPSRFFFYIVFVHSFSSVARQSSAESKPRPHRRALRLLLSSTLPPTTIAMRAALFAKRGCLRARMGHSFSDLKHSISTVGRKRGGQKNS